MIILYRNKLSSINIMRGPLHYFIETLSEQPAERRTSRIYPNAAELAKTTPIPSPILPFFKEGGWEWNPLF